MAETLIARGSLNSVCHDISPLIGEEESVTVTDRELDNFGIETSTQPVNSAAAEAASISNPESSTYRLTLLRWIFGFCLTFAGVSLNVTTPIYTLVISEKSDIILINVLITFWCSIVFFLCWSLQQLVTGQRVYLRPKSATFFTFAVLSGSSSISSILITFSMLPSRTPKFLQAILCNGSLVFATIIRKFLLKKGVSVRRIVCLGVVLLGLFIAAEPSIFNLPMREKRARNLTNDFRPDVIIASHAVQTIQLTSKQTPSAQSDHFSSSDSSHSYAAGFWSVMLLLSNIPAGLGWVLYERESQRQPHEAFLISCFSNAGACLWTLALFWLDILPGFGQSKSASQFWIRFTEGLRCHYAPSSFPGSECHLTQWLLFAEVSSYGCFMGFQVLLMAISEGGSIFSLIVSNLSVPLTSIFWLLFDYQLNSGIFWSPFISLTAVFPVVGFSIMLPAVFLFTLIGQWENKVLFDSL